MQHKKQDVSKAQRVKALNNNIAMNEALQSGEQAKIRDRDLMIARRQAKIDDLQQEIAKINKEADAAPAKIQGLHETRCLLMKRKRTLILEPQLNKFKAVLGKIANIEKE